MQIFQIILALSILVLIHELGHFTFARMFGIRVDKFFLFFDAGGVKLFSTKSSWFLKLCPKAAQWETEYGLGWLPLGGYCKVNGMIDESMDTDFVKTEPKPWEFRSKKPWQRLLVMSGGVLFNFILGIILYSFILFQWGEAYYPSEGNCIYVHENSLAAEMGFKTGDAILEMDGDKPREFHMMQIKLARDMVEKVSVARESDTTDIYIDQNLISRVLNTPSLFDMAIPFVIQGVTAESLNLQSGLQAGDRVVSLDSTSITFVQDAFPLLQSKAGQQVDAVIQRDTVLLNMTLNVDQNGNIGVALQSPRAEIFKYSALESIPAGCRKAYNSIVGQIKDLRLLAKPSTGAYKSVGSIIAITDAMPTVWNWGIFLNILAMISIVLGVMNLLPIPALDGGHIVFTLYEMITGRKPSDKFLYIMQLIGMFLIFALMFLAFGNDISRLLK